MSKKVKEVRGQVRQIVKEILPEVLNAEQFKVLEAKILERLAQLEAAVKTQMHEMNTRHKDTMSYVVRQVTTTPKLDK